MRKIRIKKLILLNFKGARHIEIDFEDVTNIYGENGTFKTTIFDAFVWLLFGKDGRDNKEFNIKTLDETNHAIPQIDHSVTGNLALDDQEMTLRRVYREKWTRRRGNEISELTGHETLFYVNDVPLQAGEYKSRIDQIVSEDLFKLLSSPLYFNQCKWQWRREVLIKIAGQINQDDVLIGLTKNHRKYIDEIFAKGKTIIDFKKEIAVRKKKLTDDLKLIPSRIDEVRRTIPESEPDYLGIEQEISQLNQQVAKIESQITDNVKAYNEKAEEVRKKQERIQLLRRKQGEIQLIIESDYNKTINQIKKDQNEAKNKLESLEFSLSAKISEKSTLHIRLKNLQEKTNQLRNDWALEVEKNIIFNPNEFECPTCKRMLSPDVIAERRSSMIRNFEDAKNKKLAQISEEGKQSAKSVEQVQNIINDIDNKIQSITNEITSIKSSTSTLLSSDQQIPTQPDYKLDSKYIESQKEIDNLSLQITEIPPINVSELKQNISAINVQIDEKKMIISQKSNIDRAKARLSELSSEEKTLSQQLADLEGQDFACDEFINNHMNIVESRINNKFKLVRWKMWNILINGGSEETCECLINGVPWADLNSAGRIQAGVDIINTLSNHYDVYPPLFIDNRESTNDIPATNCQIVNLYVSKDKTLIIK